MSQKQWNSPPAMQIDPEKTYQASIETSRGTIELELYPEHAPTTVNNFVFFGVQHRPDFVVKIDGLKIAVEVKRGDSGSAVREGIGQSIVYAAAFDFVCHIFIDTSKDKKVLNSLQEPAERFFVKTLWNNYNIRFDVVCR